MSERDIHFLFTEEEKQRLDKYLVKKIPDLSRSRIQGLIKGGYIRVNDLLVDKTGTTLYFDDQIDVHIPAPALTELEPEHIPLDIVFENDELLIINKHAGMVVHPSAGHDHGTLVHAVLAHAPEIEGVGGEKRPGIVHRLDKETSGLIIVAKNERAHRWLQDQFRLRKVEKIYLALVDGKPPTSKGRIEAPIGRDASNRKRMSIVHAGKGREALTEYFTVESFPKHTLVKVKLLTGRTHQVRLHMTFLKCPLVGDRLYGYKHPSIELNRHFLHAAQLSIAFPGESDPRTFHADLPLELENILIQLRKN